MRKKLHLLAAALCVMLTLAACESNTPVNSAPVQAADDPNAPTYTVTLDPAGGTWSDGTTGAVTLSVKEGKAVDFPSYMPEYEGNTLYGWYQTDGSPWPGARRVTGDIALRAKWSVTQEVEVYKLVLIINDEPVVMEYENGVYQFTYVSSIYGGYAQRAGKYTAYEDKLLAAMEADDGSARRVLYVAESNYIDSTGTIYAEFYNDGEFELYYDYTNGGNRTKYPMNVGYWTYEGYTPPFENTPLPEMDQMGYESTHTDWDRSLLGEDDQGEEPSEPIETVEDIVTLPGTVIYTADATVSETMKANFTSNGVMAIYMTTYGVNVDAKYLWSVGEDGLVITYNASEDNIAVDNGDGTYTFPDQNGNEYTAVLADLTAAITEPAQIYTANATVSETMFAFFYDDYSVKINYSLAGMGMEGQYAVVASGQWRLTEDDTLELAVSKAAAEVADMGDGTLQFTVGENTYEIVTADFLAGADR